MNEDDIALRNLTYGASSSWDEHRKQPRLPPSSLSTRPCSWPAGSGSSPDTHPSRLPGTTFGW